MDYQRACACRNMRAGYMGVTQGGTRKRQDMRVSDQNCNCTPSAEYPPNSCDYPSLAMAYLPYQKWDCLYEPAEALQNATLFRELNKPFLAGRRGGSGKV
ncbi:MAG: spore coat associated protein CotJA [Eubacteriales bacterium]